MSSLGRFIWIVLTQGIWAGARESVASVNKIWRLLVCRDQESVEVIGVLPVVPRHEAMKSVEKLFYNFGVVDFGPHPCDVPKLLVRPDLSFDGYGRSAYDSPSA